MLISEEQFDKAQIALVEGTAHVEIEACKLSAEPFWLSVNGLFVENFPTYTEACEWVIKTVNDGS
jgi:hypothetical protein